jgi:arginine deiminase
MNFKNYTDCILRAFQAHTKPADVVKRKTEILLEVANFHNFTPDCVLYVGFNPAILAESASNIFVTEISNDAQEYLRANKVKFNYIPFSSLGQYQKKFETVIALDEYFTFADDDVAQRAKVVEICNLAKEYVITTCKDYKNQEFKDKEFSIPALIRNTNTNYIFLEFHDVKMQDRNSWLSTVYEITGHTMKTTGPFDRRAVFFKQLAKFSHDAGAVGFSVHKNLMYKSLIKKNYEHIISIRLEHNGP